MKWDLVIIILASLSVAMNIYIIVIKEKRRRRIVKAIKEGNEI